MKIKQIKSELIQEFKTIAVKTLKQLKEEEEIQTKEILVSEILKALVDKFSSKLNNSKSIIFDSSFRDITLDNISTKDNEKVSVKINLEALFSLSKTGKLALKTDGVNIVVNDSLKQSDIGPHTALKILLRLFYTTCNYLFNGLVNSKQGKIVETDELKNSFGTRNVDSSFEIRDSFLWSLFCPNGGGFNLFTNNNIDLSGRTNNSSTPFLDVYDMANVKIMMINAFDNVNDIKNRLNIPFLNSGPFSEMYNIITRFIDKSGFVSLMLNKNFQPIDILISRPNFLKALRNDTKTGSIKMKDDVVLFIQHLKFELLKFCQKHHTHSSAVITAEDRKMKNYIGMVIQRTVAQLNESLEMKNEKEKLIFEISAVLMPEGTDSHKMFSDSDFSELMDHAEFKEQIDKYLTPYGELNSIYKEEEKKVEVKAETEKEETKEEVKDDSKKEKELPDFIKEKMKNKEK